MQYQELFSFIFTLLILHLSVCNALDCTSPPKTITVSQSVRGSFKTIQSAIDSVSSDNSHWIHIQISPGIYRENVTIPRYKSCIYLQGAGSNSTSIEWNGHMSPYSPTFTSEADNIVVEGITFKNTYNDAVLNPILPAEAARIEGDKCAVFDCAFLGVQDTLQDHSGRHYYYKCYIQGAIDFIFGDGQSMFEESIISYSVGKYGSQDLVGFIAAQKRDSANDNSGFVFKNCNITGKGKTYLGRGYRGHSRVIIANSFIADVIKPEGWIAWYGTGQEGNLMFVEEGCKGPGANKSKRVPWMKHLSGPELDQFLNRSFIDQEGWIAKLPMGISHFV